MENENPLLKSTAQTADSDLKTWLVDYVGNKVNPETGDVTVENIVEIMAKEFPEFLMVVAEENWIRGYHQALDDVEMGEKLAKESKELNKVDCTIEE